MRDNRDGEKEEKEGEEREREGERMPRDTESTKQVLNAHENEERCRYRARQRAALFKLEARSLVTP